ncbi:MAG TPA: M20 family metallopeptidase [Bacteroidia bacterium]|nr:M20 family metallopeptidase [Bacteroidia bacterium]
MEATATLKTTVKEAAKTLLPEVKKIRRHLHRHPELSFREFETSAFVAHELEKENIPFEKKTGTGIVALIEGKNPGKKIIALRADLDALPIQEKNETDYCSVNAGVMHACGHDVHTASLLGAAKILRSLRDRFEGTVKLIFQPGEEKTPGGASLMIADGVLENPAPSEIFAQHVFPSLPAGKAGFRSGMYMASTDELYLAIKGKGGHAAMPQEYINPLLIASSVLLKLQAQFMNEATKEKDAKEFPTVLAFGKIEGKGATNVIPETVTIEGTFRTMNEAWRKKAHALIAETAKKTANELGGDAELRVEHGYPFLVNEETLTEKAKRAAEDFLGKENVVQLEQRMTAEDFAFYSQRIPACFYRLGTASRDGKYTSGVHTPTFDIDENALETGMGLLAWIALDALGS